MDQNSRSQGVRKPTPNFVRAFHNLMPKGGLSKNQPNIQNPPPPLLSQADDDLNWPALSAKPEDKQQQSGSARAPKSPLRLNPNAESYIPFSTFGTNIRVPNQAFGFDGLSNIPSASLNSTGERANDQNPRRQYYAPLVIFSPSGNMQLLDREQEKELLHPSLLWQRQPGFDISPRLRVEKPPTDLADLGHTRSRPSTPGLDGNDEANDEPAEASDTEFFYNDIGLESPDENAKQDWTEAITGRRRFYNQFYDNLVLYAGLQTFHDEGSPPPYRFDKSNLDTLGDTELRQICLDCIAYLCDFDKAPGTTAAAALQKVDDNKTILWISANEGFPRTSLQNIPNFINDIIRAFCNVSTENQKSVRAEFIRKAIHLAAPRMNAYRRNALLPLNKVLESPEIQAGSVASRNWEPELQELKRLMEDNQLLPELAEWCYRNRKPWSTFIKPKELAQDKSIYWFERLKHYLYRLSAHAFAVDIIAIAVQKVPSVRNIFKVKTFPLWIQGFRYDNEGNKFKISTDGPMDILDRLLTDFEPNPQTRDDCREAFKEEILGRKKMRDDPSHSHSASPLPTLDEWMTTNREFRRYYHAELQIAEYFRVRGYEYADERFIGCSKRACYVCYHFLKWYGEVFEDQKFVLPGTHSKIIHMVKVPWIESKDNEPLFMMNKLNKQMARHIEEALLKKSKLEERLKFRNLSTNASTAARQQLPPDRQFLPHL